MNYISTRSTDGHSVSAAEAIKRGLAPDGGLYMPQQLPVLTRADLAELSALSYPERAANILHRFLTDYTYAELLADCREAYSSERFPGGAAPLHEIDSRMSALELWHGPTCAFKDMALQIMPRLLSRALVKTGETRTALILVATSGDTGKAALEGYRDIPGIRIQVFYPVDGVSRVQKLQMITQTGSNVDVTAIRGNFDDAQTGVKQIFSDPEIREQLNTAGTFLSSANSINWGRLAPQIVYYVSAYCDLCTKGMIRMGDTLDVAVPTGNFGNIFAACIAKRMGLPLGRLICASNRNNILTDFLRTGTYDRNRPFYTTISPSMDILISSNLERLLYLIAGPVRTAAYMEQLARDGKYTVSPEELRAIREDFTGYFCDEEETGAVIHDVFRKNGYLMDTHTAVGCSAAMQYRTEHPDAPHVLLVSTASPFKFAVDVYRALTGTPAEDELSALNQLSAESRVPIPAPLDGIGNRAVRFTQVIRREDMPAAVLAFAKAAD